MANIFITGSSDGLGLMTAKKLVDEGHDVVIHARNQKRAKDAIAKVSGTMGVLIGDLSDSEATRQLASDVNALGSFDAIIHNAGVFRVDSREIFLVNTLAPYILTCLIKRPKRLIFLSSGMHKSGSVDIPIMENNKYSYSDSKAHLTMFSMAVARKWKDVYSNAVDPGWVPTKMGGASAPDNLQKGCETQAWLAVSDQAEVSGKYFYHQKEQVCLEASYNIEFQDKFINKCAELTGIKFPG